MAGRNRYIALTEAIKRGKKKGHVKAVEERCLRALQREHKLVNDKPRDNSTAKQPNDFEVEEECHADFGEESDPEEQFEGESDLEEAAEKYQEYQPPKHKKAKLNGDDYDNEEA